MLGVGLLEESKGQAFNCQDADETRGLKVTDVWTPREDVCSSPTSSSISMMFMEIPILRGLGQAGVGSWAIFPAPLIMNSPFLLSLNLALFKIPPNYDGVGGWSAHTALSSKLCANLGKSVFPRPQVYELYDKEIGKDCLKFLLSTEIYES